MKKRTITGARSLCAAILIAALLLLSLPPFPTWAEEGTDTSNEYKYAVTIEFGSMTFCYDYGAWDVNEMRYKASDASQYPANGTTQGFPGWYGFDGTANRISVKYSNGNETDGTTENRFLSVELSYKAFTGTEGLNVTGVSAGFYKSPALTELFDTSTPGSPLVFKVPHTALNDNTLKTVLYISLSGEPQSSGGKYLSETFVPIGMLFIRVGETTAD